MKEIKPYRWAGTLDLEEICKETKKDCELNLWQKRTMEALDQYLKTDAVLTLPVKGVFFKQIRSREKPEEYRLYDDYWRKRIEGKSFGFVEVTHGYPKKNDLSRRVRRRWKGYTIKMITHPHFGKDPVKVFAIDVTGANYFPITFSMDFAKTKGTMTASEVMLRHEVWKNHLWWEKN